eukprot:GCRY01000363.1.p1 GENE.GCRY01000363.1~~GCRY01000363.1.p1  ORF type:complete len:434 (+),score=94.77 GCRY01000363.1:65-1366(+)
MRGVVRVFALCVLLSLFAASSFAAKRTRFGGNAVIKPCDAQKEEFKFTIDSNGKIRNKDDYCLKLSQDSESVANGGNVHFWDCTDIFDYWKVDSAENRISSLSVSSEPCLSINPVFDQNVENVRMEPCIPSNHKGDRTRQMWELVHADSHSEQFLIVNKNEGKCLVAMEYERTKPKLDTFPMVIGHRGTRFNAPENTLPAFKFAIGVGADGIETDLQLTKDGVIVLCHDSSLKRTTNCTGQISDYTYEELMKCDAGSWFGSDFAHTKIPTFEEAVELAYKHNVFIVMDLKELDSSAAENQRLSEVKKILGKYPNMEGQVIASCRTPEQRIAYSKALASVPIQRLEYQPKTYDEAFFEDQVSKGIRGYSLKQITVGPDFIAMAHRHLMSVFSWTPDTYEMQVDAFALGFDGLITSDPLLLVELLQMKRDVDVVL